MGKEYKWEVSIDGQQHTVECVQINNRYVLYADDDYVTTVYRKWKQNRNGGLDEPVRICGEECRFVVWEEQPDLAVAGQLIGRNRNYDSEREYRKKTNMFVGTVVAMLGALFLAVTLFLIFMGAATLPDANRWAGAVQWGILLLVFGLCWRRKWKKKDND